MNHAALTTLEIHREPALLPETELSALKTIIDKMAGRAECSKTSGSLAGIWRDKGFERLEDLENALRQVRVEMGAEILKRSL